MLSFSDVTVFLSGIVAGFSVRHLSCGGEAQPSVHCICFLFVGDSLILQFWA